METLQNRGRPRQGVGVPANKNQNRNTESAISKRQVNDDSNRKDVKMKSHKKHHYIGMPSRWPRVSKRIKKKYFDRFYKWFNLLPVANLFNDGTWD